MSERVILTTSDGVEIIGVYSPAAGEKFAILLHMMPATKESWDPFVEKLLVAGYDCLTIDERGHGESTAGGTVNYRNFTDAEQQAKILDLEAAFEFLQTKGAVKENTIVIGASIGANLAIQFLAEHPGMSLAVALSPGLNYHGVETEGRIKTLREGQKVLMVTSDDDAESFYDAKALAKANPLQTKLIERKDIGHGTNMTDKEPILVDEIVQQLP